ncbi:MAG: hypothetical protein LOD92_04075 [Bacillales bacterium]
MEKVQFVVNARKYFEADAGRLKQAGENDEVIVTINFDEKKADFIWFSPGENPGNFLAEEDDFYAVVELWEELGKPGEEELK